MESLIKEIKKKKELSDISSELVRDVLKEYLEKNNLIIPTDKRGIKLVIKEIRGELRKYVGRFQVKSSTKKRLELLRKGDLDSILVGHSSTKERLESNNYEILVSNIKKISPKSILDLACGINPIMIANEFPKAKYYALDIKEDELNLLREFFEKQKINGKVLMADIRKKRDFPKTDICLILKVLDIIEKKKHKKAKEIIENLKCKHLIVSFSTKTLSGKRMRVPQRKWLEKILKDINYTFKIEQGSNEIFYICKLSNKCFRSCRN